MNGLIWIIAATLILPKQIISPVKCAHGTLIIFSATKTSIIIAADSGLAQNGKIVSPTQRKIMRVGRNAACAVMGMVHLRFSGKAQANPVDIETTVRNWIAQHASSTLQEVHRGLTEELSGQFADVRVPYLDKDFGISFFCVGFDMGVPIGLRSTFSFQMGTPPKLDSDKLIFTPGLVIPVARAKVATEILWGDSAELNTFKSEAVIAKYREARRSGGLAALSEKDLLSISSACLKATESFEASTFDHQAAEVSAPNLFAVIDKQTGFRWVKLP